jgi:hypothetical protein
MVPTSGIVKTDVTIGERATKQLGGRFYHPRQSTKRAEIRVNQRQNGTLGEFQQSFAHEFGHRIDYEPFYKYNMTTSNVVEASKRVADPRTNSLDRGVAQKLLDRVGPETVQAILDLMDAAGKSESLARVLKGASKSYAEYISSPHEIFARLFAQWTGVVTDNPAMRAAALKHSFGGFQWTKDEFEALRPLLERVLRLRGVIL